MKTGIFGGAFNPFHNGHLHLMNTYLELLELDRILLIPTASPPHRTSEHFASQQDRLNMLELIAQQNPKLEVSDIEFRREGKSYTFFTVCELKEIYPDDDFYLLIGSDQYLSFDKWFNYEELAKLVTVCTMARSGGEYEKLTAFRAENGYLADSIVSDFLPLEVSSTQVRGLIKDGQSIEGLVPPEIEEYIREHALYV